MGTTITTMEITTTTMGMVGTMGVPTRDFRHAALRSMTEREVRYHLPAGLRRWNRQEAVKRQLNHKMVGANHAAYMDRFHELAKLVPHLVTPESARIKRQVSSPDKGHPSEQLEKWKSKKERCEGYKYDS
ncbi:hypothetical protein Tco_0466364 [Tanacetum coccineum]